MLARSLPVRYTPFVVWSFLLALGGCDRLMLAGELINGYGDTTVVQGLYLGAEIPDGIEIPPESGIYTAICKMFLAEVADPSAFDGAPLTGAELQFTSESTRLLDLDEDREEPGKYVATSLEGLRYEDGDIAVVKFNADGQEGEVRVKSPRTPDVDVPLNHTQQEDLRIQINSDEFSNIVGAAYDLDRGNITWDNFPDDVSSAYELNQDGVDDPVQVLVIPGDAFKRASRYVVAVGGLLLADSDDFEGANTAISTFAAAKMSMHLVIVTQ